MPETQWMTLLETADMMKRLPIQVTRMCEDGKLEYYMEDGRYFVSRESIDLFMHPRTGGPTPSDRDANGTTRRKYGRAPDEPEPSSEAVTESDTANGRDEADAVTESDTANGRDEADAAIAEETSRVVEEAPGTGDENAAARGDAVTPETTGVSVDAAARGDAVTPETVDAPVEVEAREDMEAPADLEIQEDLEAQEDVHATETTGVSADAEAQVRAASIANPDDPGLRAVEILADLRAAIARHAAEHKAFCDEIAGLADALESTLSRDEDKTSELTREISSLLARYTRR